MSHWCRFSTTPILFCGLFFGGVSLWRGNSPAWTSSSRVRREFEQRWRFCHARDRHVRVCDLQTCELEAGQQNVFTTGMFTVSWCHLFGIKTLHFDCGPTGRFLVTWSVGTAGWEVWGCLRSPLSAGFLGLACFASLSLSWSRLAVFLRSFLSSDPSRAGLVGRLCLAEVSVWRLNSERLLATWRVYVVYFRLNFLALAFSVDMFKCAVDLQWCQVNPNNQKKHHITTQKVSPTWHHLCGFGYQEILSTNPQHCW